MAVQPVHARRAGRADLHGQDRADGARHRLEVLRGHAGDRRGPPRRGLQPLPAREDRARLPAQRQPAVAARRRDQRQPLGHDLPRDAGAHRGPRPRRVRPDPQPGHATRWRKALNAYVMQDEARHVMFGRLALRDYYPQLTAGRARRARGVLRRRLLPDARPLPRRGGVGARSACPHEVAEYVEHQRAAARRSAASSSCASCRSSRTSGCGATRSRRRSPTWACSASPTPTSTPRWPRTKRPPRSSIAADGPHRIRSQGIAADVGCQGYRACR